MAKKKQDAPKITGGYICVHRSIRKHWIWEDASKLKWWLDIIMECNHASKKVNIGNHLVECKRGQSVNSIMTWGKRWGVERSTARRFINLLQKEAMITATTLHGKTTLLTVCNYDTYNDQRPARAHHIDQQMQQHAHITLTTNKHYKEGQEGEEGREALPPLPPEGQNQGPTLDAVKETFYRNGGTNDMAEKFYAKHESRGWMDGNTRIRKWAALVGKFIANFRDLEDRTGAANVTDPKQNANSWI